MGPEKSSRSFDESLQETGLNTFDVVFLNFMRNPNSNFDCDEKVVQPDRSKGWLHDQLERSKQTEVPLSLREGGGEIRVLLEACYTYPNAVVYMVRNQFKKYADAEIDFLVVDKDPHALDAILLSFSLLEPKAGPNPVPGMLRVDASTKFL